MKKKRLMGLRGYCKKIFIIFLLGIFTCFILVSAEEFKSCSLDSDCKVDVCNQNSCVNQSYLIPGCTTHNFAAKECRCANNICEVSVGSSVPVCNAETPGTTYCKDEKTMMKCDSGNWISKSCVYKCEGGQCIAGCYKNEDCGGSYAKSYCSNNEVCSDTTTPICLDFGICGSSTVKKCTPCAGLCKEGRCIEISTPDSCQTTTKCNDGTIPVCKLVDNKCECTACPAIAEPVQPTKFCRDTDNGNFYEKGVMRGATDDAGHWDLCGDSITLTEYYCENIEARKITFNCPNGCQDGACLKGESISEQVTCIFKNSDREQRCYLSEYNDKFYCSGKESCVISVKGYKSEKMVWKSTCGSYIPTLIDGQDENAEFDCKTGEATTTQIQNKGFRFAYWQCYDGSESKSEDTTSCKTSETWQKYAAVFCNGKCNKDNSKCGVNSFSLNKECYIEEIAAPQLATPTTPSQGMFYYFYNDNCPPCKDIDKEIEILKQKGFFNNFGVVVYNINDKGISEKYEIKTVPSFILYKGGCNFTKQGFMKSDEIENWAYDAKCEEGVESNATLEPILICKNSCPLDKKCYPFGYRKTGKFCSDEGKFIEQLEGEKNCDNNFECSSNVCVNGECISEGFINKILNWFKRLFGEREPKPEPAPTPTPTPSQEPSEKTKDEFISKLKNPEDVILIDFESLADKTILQNGDKLTGKEWESLGIIFETPSEEYLKVIGPNYPFNPMDKLSLSPGLGPFEDGSETHDDLNIIFTEPVKSAGFYLLDLGETDERESIAFLDKNGNVLYKISPWPKSTFGNPAPGTFVSFISEKEEISKIEILENTQDSDDIAYDNLYFVR